MTAGPQVPGGQVQDTLVRPVQSLVRAARDRALTPDAHDRLDQALRRLSEPLRVAIAGRVKAGKSTLLNALLGEELAPTDAGECTKVVTWYVRGDVSSVVAYRRNGEPDPRPFRRDDGALDVDLGAPPDEIHHLEVRWPTSRLREITFIDTPGLASLNTDVSQRTVDALAAGDEQPAVADAVVYLLRHTHASDVRFLEAFHDDEVAKGTPLNAVGVLSRADEIGSSRRNAMEVAGRIADRYESDPRLHRLCPIIVPVAGLLGQAGTTLREEEFRLLARLAELPAERVGDLLLTADRFGGDAPDVSVLPLERRHLLERLGLFGVRLAVRVVREEGVDSALALSRLLVGTSGLEQLRVVLAAQFAERSRLLKARSALASVRSVLHGGGCSEPAALAAGAEEITASAHEFTEVRLLDDARAGLIDVPERYRAEFERVLGASGHSAPARLDLPMDADADGLRDGAAEALGRWRRIAESPLTERRFTLAARGVVRTCEGILAMLSPGPGPA